MNWDDGMMGHIGFIVSSEGGQGGFYWQNKGFAELITSDLTMKNQAVA